MKLSGPAVCVGGKEDRAMDAVVEATIMYNWRCADRNGMRVLDNQWVLANALPFRAPL